MCTANSGMLFLFLYTQITYTWGFQLAVPSWMLLDASHFLPALDASLDASHFLPALSA